MYFEIVVWDNMYEVLVRTLMELLYTKLYFNEILVKLIKGIDKLRSI